MFTLTLTKEQEEQLREQLSNESTSSTARVWRNGDVCVGTGGASIYLAGSMYWLGSGRASTIDPDEFRCDTLLFNAFDKAKELSLSGFEC